VAGTGAHRFTSVPPKKKKKFPYSITELFHNPAVKNKSKKSLHEDCDTSDYMERMKENRRKYIQNIRRNPRV